MGLSHRSKAHSERPRTLPSARRFLPADEVWKSEARRITPQMNGRNAQNGFPKGRPLQKWGVFGLHVKLNVSIFRGRGLETSTILRINLKLAFVFCSGLAEQIVGTQLFTERLGRWALTLWECVHVRSFVDCKHCCKLVVCRQVHEPQTELELEATSPTSLGPQLMLSASLKLLVL